MFEQGFCATCRDSSANLKIKRFPRMWSKFPTVDLAPRGCRALRAHNCQLLYGMCAQLVWLGQ